MTAAYFEDHPTDPEKVILRKPPLDQGADYERGFVDGMQYQMQSSVDKAVNRMAQTQEPVAWGVDWGKDGDIPCVSIIKRLPNDVIEVVAVEYAPYSYITPPQRTWVNLTDEEWLSLGCKSVEEVRIGLAIQAKLKELNT